MLAPSPPPLPWWQDPALRRLLAVALVLRLVVDLALYLGDPTTRALYSDPAYYQEWAGRWARGEAFEPGRPFWMPPGYPAFLALLFRLGGESIGLVIAVQAALGLITTLRLVRLVGACSDRLAGLCAGWLWTLYLPVLFYETRLLGESLATLLAVLALEALVRAERALAESRSAAAERGAETRGAATQHAAQAERSAASPQSTASWQSAASQQSAASEHSAKTEDLAETQRSAPRRAYRAAVLAGWLTGLAALMRPNLMLHLPLAVLGAVWMQRHATRGTLARTLLSGALGLLLGLAPAALHNQLTSGQLFLVSANGGVNFWFGNQPASRGTFVAPGPEWGAISKQRETGLERARLALGDPSADERAAGRWFFGQGWSYLLENPAAWAKLWTKKLAAQFNSTEWGIMYSPRATRRWVPLLWLLPLPFGLFLALAALGRVERGSGALLGWLLGGVTATLLYFTYSRFRLPWLPALLPWSGAGLALLLGRLWPNLGHLRRPAWPWPLAGVLALLAAGQSFLAVEGNYALRLEAHALVDAARSALRLGQSPARAEAWLQQALALVPGEVGALTELGQLATARGDLPSARGYFERAVALNLDHWPAEHGLISTLVLSPYPTQREPERALAEIAAWLANHGPQAPGRAEFLSLGASIALEIAGPAQPDQARAWLTELRRLDPTQAGLEALEALLPP
jgi:tetratricopeptide (TPR) repeat protein